MPYKDPEAARANKARYRAENAERIRIEKAEYYQANRDRLIAEAATRRLTYVDATSAERMRRYRKSHPEAEEARSHARRARLANVEHEPFSTSAMVTLYGTDCHLCGEPIDMDAPRRVGQPGWEYGLHREHVVPLALGGADTRENTRPSHGLCNLKKGAQEYGR